MALPASNSHDSTFPKHVRLRQRADYLHMSQTGIKFAGKYALLLMGHEQTTEPKLGITVSKKVGCAVVRNRVKRFLREYFRQHRNNWPQADFVVIARSVAAKALYADFALDMTNLLTRVNRQ